MKVGDIVKHKQPKGYMRRGIIMEVFVIDSDNEEYRVQWLNNGDWSRCTREALEIINESR